MRNITVSVSDKAYQDGRIWAAAHGTSISAIVQHCIQNLPNLKFTGAAVMQMVRMKREALLKDEAAVKMILSTPSDSQAPSESPEYHAFHSEK